MSMAATRPLTDSALCDALRTHAAEAWPIECCGLIVRTDHGLAVRRGVNLAASSTRFELDALTLMRARRDQTPIVAIYHSHCDAPTIFSAEDQRFSAAWPGVDQVLIGVYGGVPGDIVVASALG